jgi:NTP pyrophosphatase (non-canonical NTP hydrolase)
MTESTINKLSETNVSRAKRWLGGGLDEWNPLEWAGAMCGEAGEAANAAKKLKRMEDKICTINEEARHYTTLEQAKLEVAKECADTILYALLLIERVGHTPYEILSQVFNKKSEEYGFPERI